MRALGLASFSQYLNFLQNNSEEMDRLLEVLTINLSYFFRNPETFDYLKNEILPTFQRKENLIFWSAGCAQGEEPYSLAIIAAEALLLNCVRIYGSDIDEDALKRARDGSYPTSAFQCIPQDIFKKYFKEKNANFAILEPVKSLVKFLNLDLFDSPDFGACDLIMCRNVLIYLDRKGQSVVLNNFYNHLKPDGYLVIGKVELLLGIPEANLFEVVNRTEHVYRKIEK